MKKLLLLFLLCFGFWVPSAKAQLTPVVVFRNVDPSGSCAPAPLQYNSSNGKLWGCEAGTWTLIAQPGSGSGLTQLTQDVLASGAGSQPATVVGINATLLSGLATGLLKNTTGTGVPSIAASGDLPGGPYLPLTGGALSGGLSIGSGPPLTCGTGGCQAYSEGTAPSLGATLGVDVIYANSTQHGFLASVNNGPYLPLPQGPASTTSGHGACWNSTNGGLLSDCGAAPGAGTVSTVGFTGGLISVANPTTTPAFTVAGTSGGVPYFSGAVTWASSSAGATGAMMSWGGAGNSPTSPLSLLVTNLNSATETWTLYNSTATTGATQFTLRNGAGDSGTKPFKFLANNGSTELASFTAAGLGSSTGWIDESSTVDINFNITGITLGSARVLAWNNLTTVGSGTKDIAVDRDAAGVLGIYSGAAQGTTAANYRALKASAIYSGGTTFTASGCSNGTLVGGATAGTLTLGANNCTVTITMGNSATSAHGWNCAPNDQTTAQLTAGVYQSSSNTTTATFSVPATAGSTDVISFSCIGF